MPYKDKQKQKEYWSNYQRTHKYNHTASLICEQCGKEFKVKPSHIKKRSHCSMECYSKYRTGRKLSKDICKKISKSNKGRKVSIETRRKISIANDRGKTSEGVRVRTSLAYKLWRERVFDRDNYTCKECGLRGVYLEAHHIKPFAKYPRLRLDINNGITVCKKCHAKIDSYRRRLVNV